MRVSRFSAASYRATAVVLALFVVVSTTIVGAQVEGQTAFPEAAAFATNGENIEAVLTEAGLDAAWRSAIDMHPGARLLSIDYRGADGDVVAALIHTTFELSATSAQRDELVGELRSTAVALDDARIVEREREIDRNQADVYFRGIHALTQSVAINVFAGTDPSTEALLGLDGEALTMAQREYELTNTTLDEMMGLRRRAETALADAIAAHEAAVAERVGLEKAHAQLVLDAADLAAARRALDDSARAILPDAAEAFALATVPGQTGMTPRALNAYLRAEETMTTLSPGCHISWRTIAAVASVEGLHGEYGDRRLDIDGRSDSPIIGIALNGLTVDNFGHATANLPDTDNGRYDNDPVHDRAVGPLQFIPQTWDRWQLDGDGDGLREPHDIDDAALTAAAYLCNYGSLRYWPNWSVAIFGYNHSGPYVNSIKASLDRVQRLALPEFEGDEGLRQRIPYGTWVPLPDPPPPEEETPPDQIPPAPVIEAAE